MGGAPGEALGVCVVRGWRGKLKSRQLPTDLDVYLSGASAESAATVGFCSLQAAVPQASDDRTLQVKDTPLTPFWLEQHCSGHD